MKGKEKKKKNNESDKGVYIVSTSIKTLISKGLWD